jgi:uncharacterized protein (DUF342 family)
MDITTINSDLNKDIIIEPTQEDKPKFNINHLVSANKLNVYIRIEILDKSAEVSYEDILSYLDEHNIVYGICEENIRNYCMKKEYSKELMAAKGKPAVNGIDAQLVYDFDISQDNQFVENPDGTIDFRNLNNINNVTKDTVLCHIIPPQEGIDGIDVYGQPVPYKRGNNVSFNYGSNTYISKDGLKLLSDTDGCVIFKNGKVFVDSVYKVNNVDNTTGNIDFIGSVIINGDVKEGFTVKAKGDIKIKGMVEGAFIKSDGDVVISKGMNGMGKGNIYAKGNITSKYIENATIVSEKSVFAEALINSNIKAEDSIILKGSTAAIIGGSCEAENVIYAKTVGSKINPETNLIINLTRYQAEQKIIASRKKLNEQLRKDLTAKTNELKEIEENANLLMNSTIENENKNAIQRQLMLKKIKVNNEINYIKKQMSDATPTDNIEDHKIICKGIMYPNTRITIGWMKYRVRQDMSFIKMYNDGKDISIVPLNPGDLNKYNS